MKDFTWGRELPYYKKKKEKSMRYTIVLMQNICFPKMYVTMCACSSNNHVLIIINKKRTSKGFVMKI